MHAGASSRDYVGGGGRGRTLLSVNEWLGFLYAAELVGSDVSDRDTYLLITYMLTYILTYLHTYILTYLHTYYRWDRMCLIARLQCALLGAA